MRSTLFSIINVLFLLVSSIGSASIPNYHLIELDPDTLTPLHDEDSALPVTAGLFPMKKFPYLASSGNVFFKITSDRHLQKLSTEEVATFPVGVIPLEVRADEKQIHVFNQGKELASSLYQKRGRYPAGAIRCDSKVFNGRKSVAIFCESQFLGVIADLQAPVLTPVVDNDDPLNVIAEPENFNAYYVYGSRQPGDAGLIGVSTLDSLGKMSPKKTYLLSFPHPFLFEEIPETGRLLFCPKIKDALWIYDARTHRTISLIKDVGLIDPKINAVEKVDENWIVVLGSSILDITHGKVLGSVPGLYPISATFQKNSQFYYARPAKSSPAGAVQEVVAMDLPTRKIKATREIAHGNETVEAFFVDDQARLFALIGSYIHYLKTPKGSL
jgi:hypothetical protein